MRRANLTFLFLVALTAIDVLIAVRFFTVSPPICYDALTEWFGRYA